MENLKTTFTDITDWEINRFVSTGGTRSKNIAIHPETLDQYFFKTSQIDIYDNVKYPTEFWSEIVSSKVGQLLGFNMLDYNVAFNNNQRQKLGCISKSMVINEENRLTEGVTYLQGYDSKYNPNLREDQVKYTFQFIHKALKSFELEHYINNIIEIIIFDAIVGNSDRHQENWGTITRFNDVLSEVDKKLSNGKLNFGVKIMRFLLNLLKKIHDDSDFSPNKKILSLQTIIVPNSFAPIYDSGCCLGRELSNERLDRMLNNSNMLEAYVNKGVSEIRWEGKSKKQKHFDLVNLVKSDYKSNVVEIIKRVNDRFDKKKLENLVFNVDKDLPKNLHALKLCDKRKELMIKIITLRIEKLINII